MKKMKTEVMFGLFLLILGLQGKAHGQETFNDGTELQLPKSYNIAWMKNLNDDLLISKITLPGTHDTMALHGGPAAKCQSWTLEDQLKAGIRYLDIRVANFFDHLLLMHGIVYQKAKLPTALDTIIAFLSENPSETVLVRVKPTLCNQDKVQELVEKLTANKDIFWVHSTMPTLGEARGKVVFVQKGCFKLGITLINTDFKGDYKVDKIENKENVIKEHLGQALTKCHEKPEPGPDQESVVLVYSSGTGIGTLKNMLLTPKSVAKEINPWLYHLQDYLSEQPDRCFGIIAMDFPGFDLIQKVIRFNFVKPAST